MKSYREQERKRAIDIRGYLFEDPGGGIFLGKEREFVLKDSNLNLWEGIRGDAIGYFKRNKIQWWMTNDYPPGHMLSSQIACLNHLFCLHKDKTLSTAVLKLLDDDIVEAAMVDEGYVEFEFIGEKQFFKEKSFTRGANCTSIDAAMIGINSKGQKKFFLIEWKYTEFYKPESKYIPARAEVYDGLIKDRSSPFKEMGEFLIPNPNIDKNLGIQNFYFEPFYQLMRQTLLGWLFKENEDHKCTDYCNVHIIPKENTQLLDNVTSPNLKNGSITEAWESTLKDPKKYIPISPQDFLCPCLNKVNSESFLSYLKKRYW